MNIKYYLIHGGDVERKEIMINEFKKWNFDLDNINWILHPNKNELTDELINKLIIKGPSMTANIPIDENLLLSRKGIISCTYKHYLALEDIIKNNYDYGVIIEDNIVFTNYIPSLIPLYIKQLEDTYGDWDICFDGCFAPYIEMRTTPDLLVYPKTNRITNQCHGGTKTAVFYIITNKCAKKLYENYIPFNNSPDWWMNDLFRKLNIKSFWIDPPCVKVQNNHISSTF